VKRGLDDRGQVVLERTVDASGRRALPPGAEETVSPADRIASAPDVSFGFIRPGRLRLLEEADHQRTSRRRGGGQQDDQNDEAASQRPKHQSLGV
jgi:hypothetical protein